PKEMKSEPNSSVQIWTCLPLELQGAWTVVEHVTAGKPATKEFLARNHQWVFAGYSVTMKDKDGVSRKGTITFDPTVRLKTLSLATKPGLKPGPNAEMNAEVSLGIYQLKGDTLTICYTIPPNATQPVKFISTFESQTGVVTLRRRPPEKNAGEKKEVPENDPRPLDKNKEVLWGEAVDGLHVFVIE